MSSYLIKTRSGNFLLVAGAESAHEAMNTARSYAHQFGIPLEARPTSANPLEPEPPIALYLTAGRV